MKEGRELLMFFYDPHNFGVTGHISANLIGFR